MSLNREKISLDIILSEKGRKIWPNEIIEGIRDKKTVPKHYTNNLYCRSKADTIKG
jgi:hypothetical protein